MIILDLRKQKLGYIEKLSTTKKVLNQHENTSHKLYKIYFVNLYGLIWNMVLYLKK